jgi:hypothetical protein
MATELKKPVARATQLHGKQYVVTLVPNPEGALISFRESGRWKTQELQIPLGAVLVQAAAKKAEEHRARRRTRRGPLDDFLRTMSRRLAV